MTADRQAERLLEKLTELNMAELSDAVDFSERLIALG
jgi:hypothetical protein